MSEEEQKAAPAAPESGANDSSKEAEREAQVAALLAAVARREMDNEGPGPIQCSHGQLGEPCVDCQLRNYQQLKAYYEKCKTDKGNEHTSTLTAGLKLFDRCIQSYKLTECDDVLTEIFPGCQERGRDDQLYIRCIQAWAFLRFKQFRFADSVRYFEEMKEIVGPSAALLENTGHAYNSLGDMEKAAECFAGSLGFIEKLSEQDQLASNKGGVLMGLGIVKRRLNKFEEGLELTKQSLEFYKKLHTNDHSLQAKASTSVGKCLQDMKRYDDAEPYFKDAVRIFRVTCGDESPLTANALYDLGENLLTQGKAEAALPVLEEAFQRCCSVDMYSVELRTVATIIIQLYQLLGKEQGRLREKAPDLIPYCEEALRKLEARKDLTENGDLAVFLKTYAELFILSGKIPRALQPLTRAVKILKTMNDPAAKSLCSETEVLVQLLVSNPHVKTV